MAASFDKSSIIEFFLMEAGEHIQNLNKGLLSLEKDPTDGSLIDELFRAAHTLKGSAAMMGFQGISDVAHKAEDMLGQFRSGAIPILKETMNYLFDSVDAIKLMVDSVAVNKPEDPLVIDSIVQAYKDVIEKVCSAPEGKIVAGQSAGASATHEVAPLRPAELSKVTQKEEMDLAREQTVDTEEQMFDVEPLQLQVEPESVERPPDLVTASAMAAAVVQEQLEQTVPEAQPAASAGGSLKRELEESKKTGVLEKRGLGRRAMDAPELEKQFIRVNIERLDSLMNLVGEMVVNRNRLARQVEFIKTLQEELTFSQSRLLHEIKKFEEKHEYTLNYGMPTSHVVEQTNDFFELEFDRYDDFNLLSRKVTEITNDTNEIMTELAGFFDSFDQDAAKISTITTNLQDEITMARMVEMDRLYQMLQRPVRDLALEENKQLNMVVSGGETKIDKTIFEIISDPLMHMIRNAISHGIETVEERRELGKDPTGAIILKARHEGNSIIIEIEDDGRGMDPATLRKTAVDKGFMSSTEALSLTDIEAINLIFRPGFSTAHAVGKISGRGVGMDVVSTHLAKINGRIEIKTEKGIGTRFVIRLPLTLAIAQALIVKFKEQELAVPMNLVEETTRYSFKEIQRAAGEEMVNLRGALIRLIRLNDILGAGKFPKKEETYRYPTLILGPAEKRLALMVEDIIGREEIVVKPLGEYLKGVKMFSGATISGEGNVRLILNISSLFGEEAVTIKASFLTATEVVAPEAARRKPKVLVIDDSISIRKYVQRFLDRAGYEVEVASDGMEALNILSKTKFDAVITDLEMPIMHGYDMISEMKRNPALMNIPIIVLTSRAGEKHQQKAIDMGAQDYLVKPFEEEEMLGTLKKILSRTALAGRA
jgi:chemotaxis protein histidine kinase CheA/ActR/RegA family two-component response regulator